MVVAKINIPWEKIIKVFLSSIAVIFFAALSAGTYILGFTNGYNSGISYVVDTLTAIRIEEVDLTPTPQVTVIPTLIPTPVARTTPRVVSLRASWGGPELWLEVNIKRQDYGVNPLIQRDELCTIASIRLNELLEMGKLDGHEGFSKLSERRPDLEWIFEKYSVIAEFLAMGGESSQETVSLWNNTLGHKKLLEGGEYVWGCVYAQNTFAVAITAY